MLQRAKMALVRMLEQLQISRLENKTQETPCCNNRYEKYFNKKTITIKESNQIVVYITIVINLYTHSELYIQL